MVTGGERHATIAYEPWIQAKSIEQRGKGKPLQHPLGEY